ncbi:MAG: hypothetical protein AAF598_03600 [Bacteroidota bacterium]
MNTNSTPHNHLPNAPDLQWNHINRSVKIKVFDQVIAQTRSAFFVEYTKDGAIKRFLSVPLKHVEHHYFFGSEDLTEHPELGEVFSMDYLRNRTWKANFAFLYPHGGPFRTTAQLVFPIEHIDLE